MEQLVARMLEQRAALLDQAVQQGGVLAYLREPSRPLQREKLNERFLHNTLRGVFSANKRVGGCQCQGAVNSLVCCVNQVDVSGSS